MYFPRGFEHGRAVELAELVQQAYRQLDAFKKGAAWKLESGYSLVTELFYAQAASGRLLRGSASFDYEIRGLLRAEARKGKGVPIRIHCPARVRDLSGLPGDRDDRGMDSKPEYHAVALPPSGVRQGPRRLSPDLQLPPPAHSRGPGRPGLGPETLHCPGTHSGRRWPRSRCPMSRE